MTTTTTDFARYLTRFLSEYLPHERNMSLNTIASYRDAFVQYIDFMKEVEHITLKKLLLKNITHESVSKFLKWLLEVKHCSPATRNYRLAAIHSFCSYLQYTVIDNLEQWQKILAIKAMRKETKALNYLSVEGVKLLLSQPDTTTWKGRRHLALLSLMYDTGARVQEMADLTVECLRFARGTSTIKLWGKGRKIRIIPLADEQVTILREYIIENGLDDANRMTSPLFFSARKEKLTREGITYILKKYADMARKTSSDLIPEVLSCHSLRHSKAMHLLKADVNLVHIRDLLGHVSIQTTDIYARADSQTKREALEKAYVKLTPNTGKDRLWEQNKDLRNWLKSLGN